MLQYTTKHASSEEHERPSRVVVELVWSEIAAPNKCSFVIDTTDMPTRDGAKYNAKHKYDIGNQALQSMVADVTNARDAIESMPGISFQNSYFVLCAPALPSSIDTSILSLEDERVRLKNPGPYKVRLETKRDASNENRKMAALKLHEDTCREWLIEAESNVMKVIKSPSEYTFDNKSNAFVLKRDKMLVIHTHTNIPTPLVHKSKHDVCVDGYLALKARKAIKDEEDKGGGCCVSCY